MTSKPVVVEKAKVKTDQLLTNVNKLSEPSTISKEKIELIELPKDSILPTGFRFIHPARCLFLVGLSKLLDNKYSEASRH